MSLTPYLTLLEALRISCHLPEFPDPLPSTQLDLKLENGPTLTIDFEEENESLKIFSQIGTYPLEHEKIILRKIAASNFLWTSTAGGTLSARPDIQTVYFAYRTPASSLSGGEFVNLLEKFVEIIAQWHLFLTGEVDDISTDLIKPSSTMNSGENIPLPMQQSQGIIIG